MEPTFKLKNKAILILSVIVIIFGLLLFKECRQDPETITKYVTVEVVTPKIIGSFPPIEMPTPKKVKPRPKLIEEFKESTPKKQDSLYADAVTERFYEENFVDSTQTITVKSKVQGKLLNQSVNYEIYPDTLKTTVPVEIEIPDPLKMYVGGEVVYPLSDIQEDMFNRPAINLKAYLAKGNWLFSGGVDTQGNISLGAAIKLKLRK